MKKLASTLVLLFFSVNQALPLGWAADTTLPATTTTAATTSSPTTYTAPTPITPTSSASTATTAATAPVAAASPTVASPSTIAQTSNEFLAATGGISITPTTAASGATMTNSAAGVEATTVVAAAGNENRVAAAAAPQESLEAWYARILQQHPDVIFKYYDYNEELDGPLRGRVFEFETIAFERRREGDTMIYATRPRPVFPLPPPPPPPDISQTAPTTTSVTPSTYLAPTPGETPTTTTDNPTPITTDPMDPFAFIPLRDRYNVPGDTNGDGVLDIDERMNEIYKMLYPLLEISWEDLQRTPVFSVPPAPSGPMPVVLTPTSTPALPSPDTTLASSDPEGRMWQEMLPRLKAEREQLVKERDKLEKSLERARGSLNLTEKRLSEVRAALDANRMENEQNEKEIERIRLMLDSPDVTDEAKRSLRVELAKAYEKSAQLEEKYTELLGKEKSAKALVDFRKGNYEVLSKMLEHVKWQISAIDRILAKGSSQAG